MHSKGTAIITGASRGIGQCIAQGLALDGYKTVLIARDQEKLHAVSQETIQASDILNSIRYILGLSKSTCIRELVIECSGSVL